MTTLDLILLSKEYVENEEGVVITFEDSQMAKVKQNWYLQLHVLIGPGAFRANLLITTILDGNIDDVIANLVTSTKKDKIIEIDRLVTNKYNSICNNTISILSKFKELSRKEFAIKFKDTDIFTILMKNHGRELTENNVSESSKEYILRLTNSLGKAEEFLEKLKLSHKKEYNENH